MGKRTCKECERLRDEIRETARWLDGQGVGADLVARELRRAIGEGDGQEAHAKTDPRHEAAQGEAAKDTCRVLEEGLEKCKGCGFHRRLVAGSPLCQRCHEHRYPFGRGR